MATIRCSDNWVQFNSCFEDEEEEEQEALSLCDLPTNDQEIETISKQKEDEYTPEFEFGSTHGVTGAAHSPEYMCNADEVFFQGQILPFSSATGEFGRKIHRSTSASVVNDRTTTRPDPKPCRYKPRTRNQFHSHPSPSPQIRTQSFRTFSHSNSKTSSLWSFLQVGLLKPQEIGLSDLKNRSKRFGSHNSNSSSTSSSTMNSTIEQNQNQNHNQNGGQNPRKNPRKTTKKKQRLLFGSGCKCSIDSIESTRKESYCKMKTNNNNKKKTTKEEIDDDRRERTVMIGDGKRAVSRHRTFEWLKQLSIAAPSEA